jgi:hypothetical protein
MQYTIGGGERNSAATGYLSAQVRAWPNFSIVVNARVRRVLPTTTKAGGKLDIRTVEIGSLLSSKSAYLGGLRVHMYISLFY